MAHKRYKDRIAEIYFNSAEQRTKFYELAESHGSTFSRYVINLLESAIALVDTTKTEDTNINALREELRELHKAHRELIKLSDYQAQELLRLKSEVFLAPSGEAEYNKDLIKILQSGPVHSVRLLEELNVDPRDTIVFKGITRQLEFLEATGFIKRTSNGWMWRKDGQ